MSTQAVANRLVELCSQGKFHEAMTELYSNDILSVEAGAPPGQSPESKGMEAVKAKAEWWGANHDVHSVKVDGPLVIEPFFSVTFDMDVTFKPENRKMNMKELAVYQVEGDKIVYERFFYKM